MDVVVTYVDGNDPVWRRSFEETMNVPVREKRYRDWGTLRYLLRGIEVCMPFVENVFLVVSSHSQVPSWVSDKVRIVLHEDIIPKEFLPTFNSGTIEIFLHRIEGLSERFIYFNDDLFPVLPCREEDYFVDGRPAIRFSKHFFAFNLFKKQTKNCDRCARKACGMRPSATFLRPQHSCTPMLKSLSAELLQKAEADILPFLSRVRTPKCCCQYVFSDYLYHSGRAVSRSLSNKHFSLAVASVESIVSFIENPTKAIACINDVDMPPEKFEKYRSALSAAFENRFPEISRFEKAQL